jgi:hypothetical protein
MFNLPDALAVVNFSLEVFWRGFSESCSLSFSFQDHLPLALTVLSAEGGEGSVVYLSSAADGS